MNATLLPSIPRSRRRFGILNPSSSKNSVSGARTIVSPILVNPLSIRISASGHEIWVLAASYLGLTRTFPLGVYSASNATGVGSSGWRKVASCPCGRYQECCRSCG